jgi:hypothetical protein
MPCPSCFMHGKQGKKWYRLYRVGIGAGLHRYGKSYPPQGSNPRQSSPQQVAILATLFPLPTEITLNIKYKTHLKH